MAKTAEEIAQALNVSITTVRLVLTNKAEQYRISPATQKKVEDYVAEHGYTLNYTARSLRMKKTYTLGLVVPRLSNPFFAKLSEKLETRCRQEGYQLMTSCTYGDEAYENRLVKALEERNVDGIFIAPTSKKSQEHHVKHRKKPLVFLDRDFGSTLPNIAAIVTDNLDAGFTLTDAMLRQQPSPVHFFAGNPTLPTIVARMEGYRQAITSVEKRREDDLISCSPYDAIDDGELMMNAFIDRHGCTPKALIASSLTVMEGALFAVKNRLGAIPPEMNIGTFDEYVMLSFLTNRVWSMRQDKEALAANAFNAMEEQIAGRPKFGLQVCRATLMSPLP
ncbi:LacI family DNA-binding transcriptional regulator [Leminorella grimontii]|uniref:LacI family DNA-binding transcriptional regulator n=1 Tax=Leminorella grimontii TaxID=82981 RepID=UPI0032209133